MADNDDGRLGFDMLRFIKMRDRSAKLKRLGIPTSINQPQQQL